MPWSQVETQQIVGRAHRLGQTKQVHVYAMIALRTTDVLMAKGGHLKLDMLDHLLSAGVDPGMSF